MPSPLSVHVSPGGSAPVSDTVHGGDPVTVTVKLPNWPTVKMVLPEMVIWHARLTVRPTLVILGAAIWGVAAAGRTALVALCVTMDAGVPACAGLATRAGGRCDASAACAWLSDPMATANMARTNTSFLCIDSVPRKFIPMVSPVGV